ncbi:Hypothetical_protein [Hexamita inflata]|uniref:Hypothetical_protein n=1 Tax=Hexamita inflata TaxID=28002 RepID=A0AA86R0T4_9EUKA|nr:Hypothetical protein HINF_LOCUS54627 [Hexamita inflata]
MKTTNPAENMQSITIQQQVRDLIQSSSSPQFFSFLRAFNDILATQESIEKQISICVSSCEPLRDSCPQLFYSLISILNLLKSDSDVKQFRSALINANECVDYSVKIKQPFKPNRNSTFDQIIACLDPQIQIRAPEPENDLEPDLFTVPLQNGSLEEICKRINAESEPILLKHQIKVAEIESEENDSKLETQIELKQQNEENNKQNKEALEYKPVFDPMKIKELKEKNQSKPRKDVKTNKTFKEIIQKHYKKQSPVIQPKEQTVLKHFKQINRQRIKKETPQIKLSTPNLALNINDLLFQTEIQEIEEPEIKVQNGNTAEKYLFKQTIQQPIDMEIQQIIQNSQNAINIMSGKGKPKIQIKEAPKYTETVTPKQDTMINQDAIQLGYEMEYESSINQYSNEPIYSDLEPQDQFDVFDEPQEEIQEALNTSKQLIKQDLDRQMQKKQTQPFIQIPIKPINVQQNEVEQDQEVDSSIQEVKLNSFQVKSINSNESIDEMNNTAQKCCVQNNTEQKQNTVNYLQLKSDSSTHVSEKILSRENENVNLPISRQSQQSLQETAVNIKLQSPSIPFITKAHNKDESVMTDSVLMKSSLNQTSQALLNNSQDLSLSRKKERILLENQLINLEPKSFQVSNKNPDNSKPTVNNSKPSTPKIQTQNQIEKTVQNYQIFETPKNQNKIKRAVLKEQISESPLQQKEQFSPQKQVNNHQQSIMNELSTCDYIFHSLIDHSLNECQELLSQVQLTPMINKSNSNNINQLFKIPETPKWVDLARKRALDVNFKQPQSDLLENVLQTMHVIVLQNRTKYICNAFIDIYNLVKDIKNYMSHINENREQCKIYSNKLSCFKLLKQQKDNLVIKTKIQINNAYLRTKYLNKIQELQKQIYSYKLIKQELTDYLQLINNLMHQTSKLPRILPNKYISKSKLQSQSKDDTIIMVQIQPITKQEYQNTLITLKMKQIAKYKELKTKQLVKNQNKLKKQLKIIKLKIEIILVDQQ